ncbi:DEAD/DEAH box helicase family protein [Sporosarcina sp. HYO08]|uniref:DEAD/DEAH box helicase family protein n=1 Tax=Sporosarcina sp. HYO08 TaxID=1759557 RepID=UPI00079CA946|nr:DEAD/DEAH box helicase family protein [Sporosarcina sp. HYO08]KXH80647.1 DNA helicase [Sporosarcina sp. HYO08]
MTELRLITSQLVNELRKLTETADTIYWIIAFAMKSGVQLVLPELKKAAERGADIKILTGDYLSITDPDALELLYKELPEAEIRLFESGGTAFHPKAYLFKSLEDAFVIVGSSNLSKSALSTGVEWNLYAPSKVDASLFETAVSEFMKYYLAPNTRQVNSEQIQQYREKYEETNTQFPLSVKWDAQNEADMMFGHQDSQMVIEESKASYITKLTPRPVQQLALEALYETMAEDYDKALVVLATGLGKTYLAAFFAGKFKRVLFVAHREELLHQAKESFQHVYPNRTTGIYNGFAKESDTDFVFASVYTLAADYHLQRFQPDEFDLIVIDEFHHGTASTYARILAHFHPKFLLGITATPDRLDNKDVYSLCDGNVAISIHFMEAIRQNWLSPFVYYGVFDETDYSQLRWRNNRYDEEQLLQLQIREEYAEAVLNAWLTHRQSRTIGFCSSVKQAIFLSETFNRKGYRTIPLHGDSDRNIRNAARERLENGELDIIFTVDLFNEGVDIPSVDTLLFARPTESLTVFTQQIGRGLRVADGKTHCVIIDLVGNYRNANNKYRVFTEDGELPRNINATAFTLPENCAFHFDIAVVNMLEEMKRKRFPRKEQLLEAYEQLKIEIGRRPTLLAFHLNANADSKAIRQEFKSYPAFLDFAGELNEVEQEVLRAYEDWLIDVSGTNMAKSYKMVVLLYMLSKGPARWFEPVSPKEVAPFFHSYLTSKAYRMNIDFSDKQSKELHEYNETKIANLIAQMPMTKWSGASKGLIQFDDDVFDIQIEPRFEHQKILFNWTKEICEYRLHEHFERKGWKNK